MLPSKAGFCVARNKAVRDSFSIRDFIFYILTADSGPSLQCENFLLAPNARMDSKSHRLESCGTPHFSDFFYPIFYYEDSVLCQAINRQWKKSTIKLLVR